MAFSKQVKTYTEAVKFGKPSRRASWTTLGKTTTTYYNTYPIFLIQDEPDWFIDAPFRIDRAFATPFDIAAWCKRIDFQEPCQL
jgi:hypothetical protein